jgi:GNAT superfamily N-acetyltransferase
VHAQRRVFNLKSWFPFLSHLTCTADHFTLSYGFLLSCRRPEYILYTAERCLAFSPALTAAPASGSRRRRSTREGLVSCTRLYTCESHPPAKTMSSPFPFEMHAVTPSNAAHTIPETLRLIKALALFERDPDAVVTTEELLRRAFFGDDKAGGRTYAECVLVYEEGKKPEDEGAKAIAMAVWFYTFSTVSTFGFLSFPLGQEHRELTVGSAAVDWPRRSLVRRLCEAPILPRSGPILTLSSTPSNSLEDLFVEEPYRGKGIAKKLFQHLGKICDERELPRMEWVVINWNQEAIKVYDKMGSLTVSPDCRCLAQELGRHGSDAVTFSQMSEWDLRRLEGNALKKLAQ